MKPKNVVVMLVLVALCFVAYLVISGKKHGTDGDGVLPSVWPKFGKNDAAAITIRGQGEELKLRRREDSSDRWDVIEGLEFVRADANAVDDLLSAVSRQSVSSRYKHETVSAADLKGYGLEKPTIEMELTVAGKPLLVRYGHLTREGSKVYADGGAGTDVWVVPKDAMELAISAVPHRLHDKRLFDTTGFSVAKVEIVKDGVTTAEVSRDIEQVWHVSQPFKGYANNPKFDAVVNRIVNVEVEAWEAFGAPDLEKYGLAKPTYEVRVTGKGEGKKPEVLEVGKEVVGGGCYVKEAGTKSVARVGKSFFDAITKETPDTYRDASFTRLGNSGVAVDVNVGTVHYRLEKAGAMWDVIQGEEPRRPADGEKINRLLTALRGWETVEFLDKTDPAEMGVTEKGDFIQIDRESVGSGDTPRVTLLIGKRGPDDKTVYAQRKGDGGLERVDAAPLVELLRGPQQYFKSVALEWKTALVESLARDSGLEGEGASVEIAKVTRDLSSTDKSWKWASNNVGPIHGDALNDMLTVLNALRVAEWVPFQPEKDNERMGFKPPKGATLTVEVHLQIQGPLDADPKLYVGRRRPEGGYYARIFEKDGDDKVKKSSWAFILDDETVKTLMKPLGN